MSELLYTVTKAEMDSVADAIQAGLGTDTPLAFPNGFVNGIETIINNGSVDTSSIDSFLDGSLTEVISDVTTVRANAFYNCLELQRVDLRSATSIQSAAFYDCPKLIEVNIPVAANLTGKTFVGCDKLTMLDLPKATYVGDEAFSGCHSLISLILRSEIKCQLGSAAFDQCFHFTGEHDDTYNPESLKDGFIYVPLALIDDYKSANNWSEYASQFRALEHYTLDGTITSELDPDKVAAGVSVVTFNSNGQDINIEQQVITNGNQAIQPETPSLEGYIFNGWYTDSDCTISWDFTSSVADDVILYAKWEAIQVEMCTVTLDYGALSDYAYGYPTSITIPKGQPIKAIAIPDPGQDIAQEPEASPGDTYYYWYTAWYTESTYQNEWDVETDIVEGDMDLYLWACREDSAITYHTVVFDDNGADIGIQSQRVGEGELVTEPNTPTNDSRIFDGWYTETGVEWNFNTDFVHNDLVLYAHWRHDNSEPA